MSASRAARKLKLSKNSANPPQRPAPTPATIQQHKLAALDALADSLARARGRYVLPREFSFIPAAALENLKLDYSPPNAATHAYEDFLVKLLIDYDRIESDGDPVIREQRKAGVQQVDAELERLDQSKREAFLVALSRQLTRNSLQTCAHIYTQARIRPRRSGETSPVHRTSLRVSSLRSSSRMRLISSRQNPIKSARAPVRSSASVKTRRNSVRRRKLLHDGVMG